LRLNWHPERDIFRFSTRSAGGSAATKREVLSAISKLFDPSISKLFDRSCFSPCEVDHAGDLEVKCQVRRSLMYESSRHGARTQRNLREIYVIRISHRIFLCCILCASQMYLHAFCDASMRVYGTCIYVQTLMRMMSFVQNCFFRNRVSHQSGARRSRCQNWSSMKSGCFEKKCQRGSKN